MRFINVLLTYLLTIGNKNTYCLFLVGAIQVISSDA